MLQKLRQWIRKLSFPISLLLMGVLFFTWTDNWQVYTDPIRELYNRGVQLAAGARMGHTSEPGQQDGTVSGDTVPEGTEDPTGESRTPAVGETSADTQTETMTTEEPQPTEPSEELPKEVVYHTVDDSYFDDAVFIGDSRTVGMYEYGGLEETSTFYASTGLTIYKMFDSKIVAVPGQKKKITVEEALSEKQFAKIYLMIGINEMGTGTVESFMKAYGEAVQHLQQLQPDAVIYLQAIMKVTTERSGQGDYITNEGIEARNEEIAKLADDEGFSQSRDHRAFAGLSRGAVTMYHSALCQSLDYFSWFGAFSGSRTDRTAFEDTIQTGDFAELPIHYLYVASGNFDFALPGQVQDYQALLDIEPRLRSGVNTCFDVFPMRYHSMGNWHLALYNFLQKIF